jgi:DNA mismatch endonuclease (patch repair protein)
MELPGKPDIVLPKFHAVIQVNGCFWHGHGCYLFHWPISRREFWEKKIIANRIRDEIANQSLKERGWRVLIVWECALKGRYRQTEKTLLYEIEEWLHNPSLEKSRQCHEIQNVNIDLSTEE